MKVKKRVLWVSHICKSVKLKRPSKKYKLVNVTWRRKKQRSSFDGSRVSYWKVTAYWAKEG